jgi:hypothetical protein
LKPKNNKTEIVFIQKWAQTYTEKKAEGIIKFLYLGHLVLYRYKKLYDLIPGNRSIERLGFLSLLESSGTSVLWL